MWWSTTMSSSAASAVGAELAEPGERAAVERDHHLGPRRELVRVRRADRGRAGRGSAARPRTARGTTRCSACPRRRSTWCSASVEPSASPSGVTWHASATTSAASIAFAARVRASSTLSKLSRSRASLFVGLCTVPSWIERMHLFDALTLRDRRIFAEPQLGVVLQPDLAAHHRPQVGARRPQRVRRLDAAPRSVPSTE